MARPARQVTGAALRRARRALRSWRQRPVTRDVPETDMAPLLERPGRACMASVTDDDLHLTPVVPEGPDLPYRVHVARGVAQVSAGQEVVLLVDEGIAYFELRALYVRAVVTAVEPAGSGRTDRLTLTPIKTVAWDYGKMRTARGSGADA